VVDQLGQFPYGELWYETGTTTTPWKFTTYTRDSESNNDYAVARMYINRFGRFMTVDPSGVAAEDASNPQSWNLYSYVRNNPVGMIDPTGLWCVWEDGTHDDDPEDGGDTQGQCGQDGGHWDSSDTIYGIWALNGVVTGIMTSSQLFITNFSLQTLDYLLGVTNGLYNAAQWLGTSICSAIPSGSVTSLGSYWGAVGSVGGSLDAVMNYNTGEVSGYATGGFQAGWNGGVSLTGSGGLIWGLGKSNANYSGRFNGWYGSWSVPVEPQFGLGGFKSSSSNGVTVLGASVGAALLGKLQGGKTWTDTTQPLSLGKFTNFGLTDFALYLARQICN